jgi:hypothetical protein
MGSPEGFISFQSLTRGNSYHLHSQLGRKRNKSWVLSIGELGSGCPSEIEEQERPADRQSGQIK